MASAASEVRSLRSVPPRPQPGLEEGDTCRRAPLLGFWDPRGRVWGRPGAQRRAGPACVDSRATAGGRTGHSPAAGPELGDPRPGARRATAVPSPFCPSLLRRFCRCRCVSGGQCSPAGSDAGMLQALTPSVAVRLPRHRTDCSPLLVRVTQRQGPSCCPVWSAHPRASGRAARPETLDRWTHGMAFMNAVDRDQAGGGEGRQSPQPPLRFATWSDRESRVVLGT